MRGDALPDSRSRFTPDQITAVEALITDRMSRLNINPRCAIVAVDSRVVGTMVEDIRSTYLRLYPRHRSGLINFVSLDNRASLPIVQGGHTDRLAEPIPSQYDPLARLIRTAQLVCRGGVEPSCFSILLIIGLFQSGKVLRYRQQQ